jgi:ribosomal protein S18 acetylase RimI-like enzyme
VTASGYRLREARPDELTVVLEVQHDAFARVANQLGLARDDLPPLLETLADLAPLRDEGWRFFVASCGNDVVATVRARVREDGVVEIGRLGVLTGHERRGIARALMLLLEAEYPAPRVFELFTGRDAAAPIALYTGLGYRFVERPEGEPYLVWLVKRT